MGTRVTNYEKLQVATRQHKPLILFDVEATGIMNGNDNHITQIALTAFNYNPSNGRYELQDNLFMLAKAQPESLAEIDARQRPTKENAERILKNEYVYAYKTEISRVIQNCRNRQQTLVENKIPNKEKQIAECTPRQVKKREGYEAKLEEYKNKLAEEQKLEANLRELYKYVEFSDIENTSVEEIDKSISALLNDDLYKSQIGNVVTTEMYDGKSRFISMGIYIWNQDRNERTLVTPEQGYDSDIKRNKEIISAIENGTNTSLWYDAKNLPYYKEQLEAAIQAKNSICRSLNDFIEKKMEDKLDLLRNYESLSSVLKAQGIDKDKWIQDGLGLTVGEMQVGINEFLSKYKTKDTVFATNGAYYANHYLKKDGISITDDEAIDLIQVEKSRGHAPETNKWSANIGDFAEMYLAETGKEIKTFDAYTKALCYAEMIARATGITVSNRSVNQLANAVTEKVASMDADYVMSATRASTLNWRIATDYEFHHSDYHFNCLEYVNFGNQRKYVDIDKMFKMNDNFEVTLEGDKTPIKTWEELENKIKALNSNISEELLEQIKFKYEELEKEAVREKHEQWEIMYNDGILSRNNMSAEQYEYLDSVYDIDKDDRSEKSELYVEDYDLDYEHNEESVAPADYEDEIDEELEVIHEEWGRWYRSGILTEANMTEEQKEYFKDVLQEAKESSPLVMQQKKLNSIIEQFDTDLALLDKRDKELTKAFDAAQQARASQVLDELMGLKDFVNAVNSRIPYYEKGWRKGLAKIDQTGKKYYDFRVLLGNGNSDTMLYVNFEKGFSVGSQTREPSMVDFNVGNLLSVRESNYILENWDSLKTTIIEKCSNVLKEYIEAKTNALNEKESSIKKMRSFEKE